MDNGIFKINTTSGKPSETMKITFERYAKQGLSNELIAMLTGYRKQTVDKYINENPYALNAWNNVKVYATNQFKVASEFVSKEETSKLDEEIAAVKKKLSELEAKKAAAHVDAFTWKANKLCCKEMNASAKEHLTKLLSDHNWHSIEEIDSVLTPIGYTNLKTQRRRILTRLFPNIIGNSKKAKKFMIQ